MTYRERRLRKAERLREWAEKREQKAAEVFRAGEPFRSDIAFNTQPGHFPFRARLIEREDRAHASVRKAHEMASRADEIERQAGRAIYSDDPDAVEALEARIAELEAERERWKAYNASCRKGSPDVSLLDAKQRRQMETMPPGFAGPKGQAPGYVLQNLGGNINRNRKRLGALRRDGRA